MKKISLKELMEKASSDLLTIPISVHLDQIKGIQEIPDNIFEFYNVIYKICLRFSDFNAKDVRMGGVAVINSTIKINTPKKIPIIFNKIDPPPSIFFYRGDKLFENDDEEYRRTFKLEGEFLHGTKFIYRSFRIFEGVENNWEFINCTYIVMPYN